MSRLGEAMTRMRFVFTRVAQHLSRHTARTKDRAAQIFASLAVFFFDAVTSTDILAGTAERIDAPNRKQNHTEQSEGMNRSGNIVSSIRNGGEFQGNAVNNVANHQGDNHRKRATCGEDGTGFSEPGQLHTTNDMAHGNLSEKEGAPERSVADTSPE